MFRIFGVFVVALAFVLTAQDAGADHPSCTVGRVIDGDTYECTDGTKVRLLQINTPERGECGFQWATDALANIFLRPGTVTRLEYDAVRVDRYGRHLAAPIVVGTDGTDYNISIVMVYVGLARAAYYGDNAKFLDWANASETWARNAGWNMWKPGGPYNGGIDCGGGTGGVTPPAATPTQAGLPIAPPRPTATPTPIESGGGGDGDGCHPSYPDFCIPPPPPDLDCGDIGRKRFTVLAPDPHGFDRDHDGVGCES